MEIEYTKPNSTKKRRNDSDIRQLLKDTSTSFVKPLKNTKLNNSTKSDHLLNNTEKCFIYLSHCELQTESKTIAKTLERDKRTVEGFIRSVKATDSFAGSHSLKGRWKKGKSSLSKAHKRFINQWLQKGEINRARSAWIRLNQIRNLKKISYHPVQNYLKTLGEFVKPGFKTEISEKNKKERLKYCEKFLNYSFKKVLFSDESIFQLNGNNTKVFHFKGEKTPKITQLNPNAKIMVWAGISYYGKTSLHIIEKNVDADEYLKNNKKKEKRNDEYF